MSLILRILLAELMDSMHLFGNRKVEHQKLVIPAMTVFKKSNLPANESDLALQEEIRSLICWIKGAQFARDSFFVHKGSPRYFIGNDPLVIPVEKLINMFSVVDRP